MQTLLSVNITVGYSCSLYKNMLSKILHYLSQKKHFLKVKILAIICFFTLPAVQTKTCCCYFDVY